MEREEVINMQHIGHHNDHLEHFSPFDQPDVYYDNVNQAIIIDGDGAVDYYDVEIASVTNFVTVISGVRYEIEASGTVTLHDGFKVEKGATFAINPSCF